MILYILLLYIHLSLDQCKSWLYQSSTSSSWSRLHPRTTTNSIDFTTLPLIQPVQQQQHGRIWSLQLLAAIPPHSEPTSISPDQFSQNGEILPVVPDYTETMPVMVSNMDGDGDERDTHRQQQLWLDLRGTALFPKEAIRFIHDQCCPNADSSSHVAKSPHLIDAVLVSSNTFDRIISSSSSSRNSNDSDNGDDYDDDDYDDDYDDDDWYNHRLYYTTPEQIVILHEPTTQQSVPIGTTIRCSEKEKRDLDIVALADQVVKQQQWVILQETTTDTTKSVSKYMLKQLTDFIHFLTSSSNIMYDIDEMNYAVTASGLFLPPMELIGNESNMIEENISSVGTSTPNKNSINASNSGGIAMLCSDRTSFMMIDAMLAEFRQLESIGTTTTTLSGITIPSSIQSKNHDTTIQSSFVTALVIPLDVSVWETIYNNNARYTVVDNNEN